MLSNLKSRLLLFRRRVHTSKILPLLLLFLAVPTASPTQGQAIEAESKQAPLLIQKEGSPFLLVEENTLQPLAPLPEKETASEDRKRKLLVYITGYSSSSSQTDSTPFITAAGTQVREGIVATNLLPFGTKIRIPRIYGDKTFIVEDRMHPRNSWYVDIWFPSYWEAKSFGVRKTHIEVLN